MELYFNQTLKKFKYDSEDEREVHVEQMINEGWEVGGKQREFIGKLLIDDTKDDKNYVIVAWFYKS